MKIGFNTLNENPFAPTNASRFISNLLVALDRIAPQHEYLLVVGKESVGSFGDAHGRSIRRRVMPYSNERRLRRLVSEQTGLPRLLAEERVDLFHAVCGTVPLGVACPSVWSICTMHHRRFAREIGLRRASYRRVMFHLSARKASVVIANSHSNRSDILEFLPVPDERVLVVPEALDELYLELRSDDDTVATAVRSRLGLRRPFVLFASALYRYKNLECLLDGFAALPPTLRGDLDIAVAGFGVARYVAELKSRAQRLGIAKQVQFLGHIAAEELRLLYQRAEVFSYPSRYETFGHPPLQAMAQGTPVVASDASSVPEVVADAAILHSPDDPEALARALESTLTNASLRRRLVSAGFQRAAMFTWERTAAGLLQAYEMAVSK